MIYKQVKIQGFKSFTSEKVFNFPDNPGLFSLSGDNKVDPDLEGNGVGKSTIGDAICWAFFGKTPKGAKAKGIKNWYSKDKVRVEVIFEDNDESISVVRTWSPNTLAYQGEPVSQDELEKKLGFSYSEFLTTVIIAQGQQMFFDMLPSARLKVFSDTLELEQWDEFSFRAKREASKILSEISSLTNQSERISGRIEALEEEDYSEEIVRWNRKEEKRVKKLKTQRKAEKANLENLKEKLKKKEKKRDGLSSSKELPYIDELNDITEEIASTNGLIAEKRTLRQVALTKESKLLGLSAVCPSCSQKVSEQYKNKLVKELSEEVVTLEQELLALEQEVDSFLKHKDKYAARQQDAKEKNQRINDKQIKLDYELRDLRRQIEAINEEIIQIKSEIKDKQKNPYLKKEERRIDSIKSESEKRDKLQEDIDVLSNRLSSVNYWKKGFGTIKLFLIQEALSQFEMETNQAVQSLGLHNWKVEYVLEKENSTGGTSRGFNILIYSPMNKEPVTWESWSGGEAQRLKVAGMIGLSNLISNRKGLESNLEIWDEPASYLSDKGVRDTLDTLRDRAYQLGKSIFVVDHTSAEFGGYEGIYLLTKTEEGTSIIEPD